MFLWLYILSNIEICYLIGCHLFLWLAILDSIEICDVIGCYLCEEPGGFLPSLFGSAPYLVIKYISKGKNYKWTAENVHVTGSREECDELRTKINDKLGQGERRKNIFIYD